MKHLVWLGTLEAILRDPAPLSVVDTHAGAGLYALDAPEAMRSGEAVGGIGRLVQGARPPPAFKPLLDCVRAENGEGPVRRYPGSPLMTLSRLRPLDAFIGCELRADDHAALKALLSQRRRPGGPALEALCADGYATAPATPPQRRAWLVDPPFERGDEAAEIIGLAARTRRVKERSCVVAWAPLKDLESLDALIRGLEALDLRRLEVAELRLRPPLDPLRLNGSAMILVDAPPLGPEIAAGLAWLAGLLGPTASSVVRAYKVRQR